MGIASFYSPLEIKHMEKYISVIMTPMLISDYVSFSA